jgi:hypothetical protein
MELDRLAAALRPRRPWEGLDLGFALGRTWLGTLWPLWWASALPCALLALALSLPVGSATLWMLAVWWLKPLYEAPLAIWISRALFGERLPLRALPSILRLSWTRRLLPFLLWRRLSPTRSFGMPVALLEGLSGAQARARRQVLHGGSAAPGWLTIVCYHFEAFLWGGMLIALAWLIPDELPRLDLGVAVTDSESWLYWLSSLLYIVAFSLIAPFYTASGFALYLTRRTELEAWDLELELRQAERPRIGPKRARTGAPATVLVAAAALALLGPVGGRDASATELPTRDSARTLIAEILKDPAFGETREMSVWVPILGSEQQRQTKPPEWLSVFGDFAVAIGAGLKWLLLALAVAAVALLARRVLRDWRPRLTRPRRRRAPQPQTEPIQIDSDPHPDGLANLVRARLAAGDIRGALALLYRGGLAHLARRGADVPKSITEGESLRLAARHLAPVELKSFRGMTGDWQALAYAHRVPAPDIVSERLEDWLSATAGADIETPSEPGHDS